MPEHELQHERRVADHLDIAAGQPAQQRVGGQPREAERHAEDGGDEDADDGDPQGVEQADGQRARVGVGRGVGDDVLADRNAGRALEEAEAELQPPRRHVGNEVGVGRPADEDDEREERGLPHQAPRGGAGGQRNQGPGGGHGRLCGGAAHRGALGQTW